MDSKPCSRCSHPAEFSLAFLLSTIGRSPRLQKCTKTIALCSSCLLALLQSQACSPLADLNEALRRAYTAFVAGSGEESDSFSRNQQGITTEDHHVHAAPSVSCRLCLIACNSRQIDEVTGIKDKGR